jgi:hypothetical protein
VTIEVATAELLDLIRAGRAACRVCLEASSLGLATRPIGPRERIAAMLWLGVAA